MHRYLPVVFLAVSCCGMVVFFGSGCLELAGLYQEPSVHEIQWIMMQSARQPGFLICGLLAAVNLIALVVEIHWFSYLDSRLAKNIQKHHSDPAFPLSCETWKSTRRAFEQKQAVLRLQLQEQQYRYENLCHQLKSGLCALQLQADISENPPMIRAVRHMNELVENMLKTAGQSALEKGMTFSSLSLDRLVTEVVMNHPYMTRIQTDLSPVQFHGDCFYLQELLLTLLDNALDACSGEDKVFLQLRSAQDHIFLTVKNQGLISQDQLDAAFQRYVTSSPGHFGIGLAMAGEIAQAHHGILSGRASDGWITMTLSFPHCRLEREIL
ncbi:sensor histidine kinase [Faecalibaculum rodentium]|uniref:sensor histidine kinase n=1 Tax=Faecalibaculum rodentium TaxID=1702221 RepID=UPI00260EA334|nr:HAMP domain-containing sensor histidine kinase [Faecalibaculum rodentium]